MAITYVDGPYLHPNVSPQMVPLPHDAIEQEVPAQPLVVAAANVNDVLYQQLDYLIKFADCSPERERLERVREILMQEFAEPKVALMLQP